MGRIAEAVDDGRRSLAMARELGYPAGEALALARPQPSPPMHAGDLGSAVQLARQAEQITAGIPGRIARVSYVLTGALTEAGDLAAAEASARRGWPGPGTWATWRTWRPADVMATWTCGRAASRTPRRTCGKGSRSPCGPAAG